MQSTSIGASSDPVQRLLSAVTAASMFVVACGSGGPQAGDALATGRRIYSDMCSTCHLSDGSGGSLAEPLIGVLETFPNCGEHIRWVTLGSARWQKEVGPAYGATDKVIDRVMPGWGQTLSAEEIAQVAAFERVRYGGGDEEAVMADCGVDSRE